MRWDFFVHFLLSGGKKDKKKIHWYKWKIWKACNWVVEPTTITTTKSFCCSPIFPRGLLLKTGYFLICPRCHIAAWLTHLHLSLPSEWAGEYYSSEACASAEGSPQALWPHADISSATTKSPQPSSGWEERECEVSCGREKKRHQRERIEGKQRDTIKNWVKRKLKKEKEKQQSVMWDTPLHK